jgi:ribose transport system substrate-binding protein
MKSIALKMQFLKSVLCSLLLLSLVQSCTTDAKKNPSTAPIHSKYKSEKDLSGVKVGYCTPSLNAPFYAALQGAIKASVESYGMTFVSADGQDDISKQIAAIEDLMAKGVNVLIIDPLDPEALAPITKIATKSGIAVFIVDSQLSAAGEYVSSIQANNSGNGILIGEWVALQMGAQPLKVAIISGAKGNPVGREKRQGMLNGITETQLAKNGNTTVNILAQGWGNWSNNGGLKAMEDILVAHPDVNVVLAENDAMAMGALKAISENGNAKNVVVVGVDGQKEAYELIKKGVLACTAINSPDELGSLVVESAVRYLNGEKTLPKIITTPAVVVDKDNVARYYNPKAIF